MIKKQNSFDPAIVVAIAINLFFFGNALASAWSLLWPTVPGTVIDTQIGKIPVVGKYNTRYRYSLQLVYAYSFGATEHTSKTLIDVFYMPDLCKAKAAEYKDKEIKVYVNPTDPNISTIKPGHDCGNSLICTILVAALSAFLYMMKPNKRADVSEQEEP